MKKRIYFVLTLILSLVIFCSNCSVEAATAMYKKCDYVADCEHWYKIEIPYEDFVEGLSESACDGADLGSYTDRFKTACKSGIDTVKSLVETILPLFKLAPNSEGNIVLDFALADEGNFLNSFTSSTRPDIDTYVTLTDSTGVVKLYGFSNYGGKAALYNLDDDAVSSADFSGCWLKDFSNYSKFDWSNFVKNSTFSNCNSENTYGVSSQTINFDDTCPSCIASEVSAVTDVESFFETWWRSSLNMLEFPTVDIFGLNKFQEDYFNFFGSSVQKWEYVPIDNKGTVIKDSTSYIEKSEYVIYKYESNGKTRFIAEGYSVSDSNGGYGAYSFVGPNIFSVLKDDILIYQLSMIDKNGKDFWRVHDNFESRMISLDTSMFKNGNFFGISVTGDTWDLSIENVCQNGEDDCIKNHGYEVIISSSAADMDLRKQIVADWYSDISDKLNISSDILEVVSNTDMINECEIINSYVTDDRKKQYNLSPDDAEKLVTYLEGSYAAVEKAYEVRNDVFVDYCTGTGTKPLSSLTSYLYMEKIKDGSGKGMCEIKDLSVVRNDRYYLNQGGIVSAIMRDLEEAMNLYLMETNDENLEFINIISDLDKYTTLFYTTVAYLESYANFDADLMTRLDTLKDKFKEFVNQNELEIHPVVNCEGLIGEDLVLKINSYLNIVKIAIPILLIALGVFDFVKAFFASDEQGMKKAQGEFIKRIVISVIFFLTPTLVNLILKIANEVWPIITPSSCGIFN